MSEGTGRAATVQGAHGTARPTRAHMPTRPAIPMTLWGLAATVLAERAVLRFACPPSSGFPLVAAGAVGVAAATGAFAVVFVLLPKGRQARPVRSPRVPAVLLFALVTVLSGALVGWLALGREAEAARLLSTRAVSSWELRVDGDMVKGGRGWRGRAGVFRADGSKVGTVWLSSPARLEHGSLASCVGRFKANGDDDWGTTSRMQGIAGTVSVVHVTSSREVEGPLGAVLRARRAVLASFSPYESDGAAVLAGSVCGDRSPLRARGLDGAFSACGVSHLVAVSGSHLAILAGTLSALLGKTRLRPAARGALALGAAALFVVFCGAPASAVRAGIMSCVSFCGGLAGRRSHALSSACAAALAMALLDPYVSGQLGFLLSVASVVGICLFGGYVGHALDVLTRTARRHGRRRPHMARSLGRFRKNSCDALGVSVVAQVFTLPLTCPTFGEVSLIAPLANLVLTPLFVALVSLGLGAAALTPLPALQAPVLAAARGASQVFCAMLSALSRLPFACLAVDASGAVLFVVLFAACAAIYVAWPAPRRRHLALASLALATCFAATLFCLRFFQPPRICVLDVGQGDAILVTDGAAAVLVDAGPDGTVSRALARQGIIHLDAIVLTHLHDDHVHGVDDLVGHLACEHVLVAQGVADNISDGLSKSTQQLTGHEAEEISYGDTIVAGSFSLRVISPVEEVAGDKNEDSVMLALSYEHAGRSLTGLLTGDAERDETGACLARSDVGDIDVLKVGHHGSEVSVTDGQAALLDPEVSVASAGENNRYGHPRKECVDALEGVGSVFLCTKDVGTVTVRPGATGPVVQTERAVTEAPSGPWERGL
ncbi:MAG: ComEC/Rec2 family competence protein [Olsenella sp.]|nr:ComEC/Rec2 family competence protein [Olsenella sp.]MCI1646064.1 ComEC/Rec2 family competence protein [Olsenella sp.]MCI1793941.1 ComEC/Rec2 family competence protein [Olsenella sp.]MCI1879367.1 ComEC/Rec2 family competence protein [Olsenella sp.]MCI2156020.1 ComEC/Rec2 family competence protein [Olsenella sp.]